MNSKICLKIVNLKTKPTKLEFWINFISIDQLNSGLGARLVENIILSVRPLLFNSKNGHVHDRRNAWANEMWIWFVTGRMGGPQPCSTHVDRVRSKWEISECDRWIAALLFTLTDEAAHWSCPSRSLFKNIAAAAAAGVTSWNNGRDGSSETGCSRCRTPCWQSAVTDVKLRRSTASFGRKLKSLFSCVIKLLVEKSPCIAIFWICRTLLKQKEINTNCISINQM